MASAHASWLIGWACRYCRLQSETAVKSARGTRHVGSSSSAGRSRRQKSVAVPSVHSTRFVYAIVGLQVQASPSRLYACAPK